MMLTEEDFYNKILAALLENDSKINVEVEISIDEQKRELLRYINYLSIDNKLELMEILYNSEYKQSLQSCSEGIVVNLDTISEKYIRKLYNLLLYLKNKQ